MANEISVTTQLTWSKGGDSCSIKVAEKKDQTGTTAIENIQTIGLTSEAIVFGDVTDPVLILFKNEDETNDVYVGIETPCTTVNAEFHLTPGQGVAVPAAQVAWYAICDVAEVNLLVVAIQR